MSVAGLKPIEIMSVGRRPSYSGSEFEFTEADLQRIAESFSEAPFVPGHPKDDAPVVGRATRVEFRDGKLMATEYSDVDPTFKAIVNSGELPGVSVKLRLPGHPDNKTGHYEIAHIGFLGRSLPADENLNKAEFQSADVEAVFYAHPTGDPPMTTTATPQGQDQQQPDRTAEFAAKEAEIAAKEAALEARQAAFARRESVAPWIEEQVIAGRLMPGEKAAFVELFAALPDELEIEFAQGGEQVKQPMVGFLKGFIKALPKRVEYAEFAKAKGGGEDDDTEEEMSATDKARQVLMKRYAANSRKK